MTVKEFSILTDDLMNQAKEIRNPQKREHILKIIKHLNNPHVSSFEVSFSYAECDINGGDLLALEQYVDNLCKVINSMPFCIKFCRDGKGSTDSTQALLPLRWKI